MFSPVLSGLLDTRMLRYDCLSLPFNRVGRLEMNLDAQKPIKAL